MKPFMPRRFRLRQCRWTLFEPLEGRLLLSTVTREFGTLAVSSPTLTQSTQATSSKVATRSITTTTSSSAPTSAATAAATAAAINAALLKADLIEDDEDGDFDITSVSVDLSVSGSTRNSLFGQATEMETQLATFMGSFESSSTNPAQFPIPAPVAHVMPPLSLVLSGDGRSYGGVTASLGINAPRDPLQAISPQGFMFHGIPGAAVTETQAESEVLLTQSQKQAEQTSSPLPTDWLANTLGSRNHALDQALDHFLTNWDELRTQQSTRIGSEPLAFGVMSVLVATLSFEWLSRKLRKLIEEGDTGEQQNELVGLGPYGFPETPGPRSWRKS